MKILVNPKHFDIKMFDDIKKQLPSSIWTANMDETDADVLITWSSGAKKKVLEKMTQLKLIMLPSAGYDQADIAYIKKRGIMLTNARTVYDIQIAEDVVAKISYFNRDMACYQKQQELHVWQPQNTFYELYHQTVGIIGAGSIGQQIAKRLKSFDTHLIGYRRHQQETPYFDEIVTGHQGLTYLLNHSDYVILAVPLNEDTYHLMDDKAFQAMKKDALLINIARGQVIDEKALIYALNHHLIRGAALDVAEHEPLSDDDPLWDAKHVLITPHIAGRSPVARQRVHTLMMTILKQMINQEPIINRVI